MAKISALTLLDAPTGEETVPILAGGVTMRAKLAGLLAPVSNSVSAMSYVDRVGFDPFSARAAGGGIGGGSTFVLPATVGDYYEDTVSRRLVDVTLYVAVAAAGAKIKVVRKVGTQYQFVADVGTIDLVVGKNVFTPPLPVVLASDQTLAVYLPPSGKLSSTGNYGVPLLYITGDFAGGPTTPGTANNAQVMVSATLAETGVATAEARSRELAMRAAYPVAVTADPYGAEAGQSGGTDNVQMLSDAFNARGFLHSFTLRAENATPGAIATLWARNADGTVSFRRALLTRDLVAGDNVFTAGVDFPIGEVQANWCVAAWAPGAGLSITRRGHGAASAPILFAYLLGKNIALTYRQQPLRVSTTIRTAPPPTSAGKLVPQSFKRFFCFRYAGKYDQKADANGKYNLPVYDMPIMAPTMTTRGLGDHYVRRRVGVISGLVPGSQFGNMTIANDPFSALPLWMGMADLGHAKLCFSTDGLNFRLIWSLPTIAGATNTYVVSPFIDHDGTLYLSVVYEFPPANPGGGVTAASYLFRATASDGSAFENLGKMTGPALDGISVIDTTIYRQGDTYYLAGKKEADATCFVAQSTSINGPWTMTWDLGRDKRFGIPNGGLSIEAMKLDFRQDGSIRIYFDCYSVAGPEEGFSFMDAPYFGGPLGPICKITTLDDLPARADGSLDVPRGGHVVELPR